MRFNELKALNNTFSSPRRITIVIIKKQIIIPPLYTIFSTNRLIKNRTWVSDHSPFNFCEKCLCYLKVKVLLTT
ncbi:hypothetical protein KSS87_007998 [Heliosperma pusillum]|nr:hypothetical protein KSS87_007998 [Heliosperma pusillum]